MSDRPRRERGVSLGRHMHARMYWYCMHACGKRQAALGGLMILPTSMQQVEGEWSETGSDRTVGPTFVPRCHLFRPGILGKPSLFPKLLRLLLRIYIYIKARASTTHPSCLTDLTSLTRCDAIKQRRTSSAAAWRDHRAARDHARGQAVHRCRQVPVSCPRRDAGQGRWSNIDPD